MSKLWVVSQNDAKICPLCGKFAVVELPEWMKQLQPDNTTHVCHPGFGGCNWGFGPKEEKDAVKEMWDLATKLHNEEN